MSKICPIVVVSCLRDIKLLALQAQSLDKWLEEPHDIYVLVNETILEDEWNRQFDLYCRKWYQRHNLNVLYKKEFDCLWSKNPSARWSGWDNQQLLKLAVSLQLNSSCYFVLDSQNFLVQSWSTSRYPFNDLCPGRKNFYTMNQNTWVEYSREFGLNTDLPTKPVMTISTPIYLRTDLVKSLVSYFENLKSFSQWFFSKESSLSEFVLYYLWSEKQGGYDRFHYEVDFDKTWNGPMMRLHNDKEITKERSFSFFIENLGRWKSQGWASITHNSWNLLDENQLSILSESLKKQNIDIGLFLK